MDNSSDIKKEVCQVPSKDCSVSLLDQSERLDLHHSYTYLQKLRLSYKITLFVCSSASATTSYF
jgi:hypothetical protein